MWLENFLIPELKPGQVVIMDNATFHKSQQSQELIKKSGCQILFLPPYSPDLNPIEKFWANFKQMVRANLEKIQNLAKAIDSSFLTILETNEKSNLKCYNRSLGRTN
jgi:transposase